MNEDQDVLALISTKRTRDEGFKRLMQKYQERVYWHVRRMVVDHDDADDVVQNTFIKVYRGIHSFKGQAKLYTWIYRIATNESITFLKQKKRKQTESMERGDFSIADQLCADPYFDGSEVQLRLQEAVAALPEKQKLVFLMKYYDEMSYQEISEVLETSIGGLKASFHHAVKKVKKHLTEVQL